MGEPQACSPPFPDRREPQQLGARGRVRQGRCPECCPPSPRPPREVMMDIGDRGQSCEPCLQLLKQPRECRGVRAGVRGPAGTGRPAQSPSGKRSPVLTRRGLRSRVWAPGTALAPACMCSGSLPPLAEPWSFILKMGVTPTSGVKSICVRWWSHDSACVTKLHSTVPHTLRGALDEL